LDETDPGAAVTAAERSLAEGKLQPPHGTSREGHHREKRVGEPVKDRYDGDAGQDAACAGGGRSFP